jgi:hypothetical protein
VFVLKLRHLLAYFLVYLLFIPLLREIVSNLLYRHLLTTLFYRHISCRTSAFPPLPRINPSSKKQLGNVVALSHYNSPSLITITGKSVALLRRSRLELELTVVNPIALFLYSRHSPGTIITPPLRVLAELGLFLTYRIAYVRVGRYLLVVTVNKPGFRP